MTNNKKKLQKDTELWHCPHLLMGAGRPGCPQLPSMILGRLGIVLRHSQAGHGSPVLGDGAKSEFVNGGWRHRVGARL